MLRSLIGAALRLRLIVVALAVLLLAGGAPLVRRAPLDVFPEFAPPMVEIQTEAPGLSTAEVESLVTLPIEQAVQGLPWLRTLRSKSVLGLSSVVMLFAEGTDPIRARQLVGERMGLIGDRLPSVAQAPVLLPPLSSTSRLLKVGISSKVRSQVELTTLARWTIRPRLMAIPGVANVAIWGQRDRELQVRVDPERLRAHGVTLEQVVATARDAVTPAEGGFVDTPNQRLAVTQVTGVHQASDLAQAVVTGREGAPVLLGEAALVVEGFPPPIGDAVIDGGPGLLLIVEKQPWGNTLEVTRAVERALADLRPVLQDVKVDPTIFRPATFIEHAVGNLTQALWIGCALVIAVLLLFLFDLRAAFISCLAIPLSLLAAALVLWAQGATLNTMVLAGLALALGEVVDDAIIDVENIRRRLRLNAISEHPRPALRVVFAASLEVRAAVVVASLVVAAVFLPVFFLPGLAGTFFRPLALAYVLAVAASLLVALTLTPALALLLLPSSARRIRTSPVAVLLERGYRALLPAFVRHSRFTISGLLVLLAGSAVLATRMGEAFLPDFREYDFLMHWVEKPGTSLDAMRRITVRASDELRAVPGVRNFGAHLGRAQVADEVVGPNFTELWISLDPAVDYHATVARIQEVVDGYPGLHRDLLTYLRERVKEVLSGTSAALVVRIYGDDLDNLLTAAGLVARSIAGVQGIADLKVEPLSLVPQVEIEPRPEALARYRLSAGALRRAVATLVQGTVVGEVHTGYASFAIAVRGIEQLRQDPASLHELRIDLPGGGQAALGELADVRIKATPNAISRENGSRRIDVTCNARDRDIGSLAREVEDRVRALTLPPGCHPSFLGEQAARVAARDRMLLLGAFSLVLVFLLLQAEFGSTRLAVTVFLGVPFALVGGVLAAFFTDRVLSLGSMVGFVTVLGIAARNGILMVSHWQHLEDEEGLPFGLELVVRGACERLAPILMTALATGLALVPLAVGDSKPGQEIEHPMAVVIVGGLATSTLLNLVLLPALYLRFGRRTRAVTELAAGST